jgi:hypothetical protein
MLSKVSEAMKKNWADPEYRKNLSKGRSERSKKLWADPEYRARQHAGRVRMWRDPAYRATGGFKRGDKNPAFKHGDSARGSRSVEVTAFYMARGRCTNPNNRKWKDYGGRGIRFLFDNFQQFLAEVGRRPSKQHSLDRYPNNDGHYEPGNVRWATRHEQSTNRRPSSEWTYNCQSCGGVLVCNVCREPQLATFAIAC